MVAGAAAVEAGAAATGFGAVGYDYRIGAFEVTNGQYVAFLNAVAASDPNGLYDPRMTSDPRGGITRAGSDGSFIYLVQLPMSNKPVNFVSWYDAARMANWMTNGQGSGGTETGVYILTGPTSISGITRDLSSPNQVFIPTEDEWYKAAYHQPSAQGGDTDDYWLYATQSNSVPISDNPDDNPAGVNYRASDNTYAVSGTTTWLPNPFTDVGAYTDAASPYGAFDLNGNAFEYTESLIGSLRGVRGGSALNAQVNLLSLQRGSADPAIGSGSFGFRLASPAAAATPCNPADLAADFGSLDFNDINAFVAAFLTNTASADLNGDSLWDFNDINAFVAAFLTGCP